MGVIGEEKSGEFKTYHYDYRGSTVAITDDSGAVTDTFEYDSYGKLINRTGESFVIFGYNGRDGVITDYNGLLYMRARYYSPELRRFINADIVPGEISNAITLNRYAYANGNPVSNIDPFGLSADRLSINLNNRNLYSSGPLATKYRDLEELNAIINKYAQYSKKQMNAQYKSLLIKALNYTLDDMNAHFKMAGDIFDEQKSFEDAISKVIYALNNGGDPESFDDDIKMRITINPDYNTSSDEFVLEIAGFFPILGEITTLADFLSYEEKDFSTIKDMIVSSGYDKFVQKRPFNSKILNNLGKIFLFGDILETSKNWNSESKKATSVNIFVQSGNHGSYMYSAVVDSELMFKKMASGYTGMVINPNDPSYEFLVE